MNRTIRYAMQKERERIEIDQEQVNEQEVLFCYRQFMQVSKDKTFIGCDLSKLELRVFFSNKIDKIFTYESRSDSVCVI